MALGELTSGAVVSVSPSTPVPTLAERMLAENVRCVVVTEQSRPVGVVTDRELALSLTDAFDVTALDAADLMDEAFAVVHTDACVRDVLQSMHRTASRRATVVDDARRLVGVVTLDQLVATVSRELVETIRAVGPPTQ
ncbi:CBS domain-containing protein [Halomarina oriensis]|uniref:CBS domain-containing protein n=1 Tax=Halomarina oriensis TaxID=671145 RepID=A0A6B0GSK3_9EURY|nr:CBS domain-containing protein [Halomarina oriensis]MWG35613.1 CBS domain-containing protein [Halomarina oriensis]